MADSSGTQPPKDPVYLISTDGLRLTSAQHAHFNKFLEWYDSMVKEAEDGPFRLEDLPAEMRNKIYSFAAMNEQKTERVNLADHALPTITRASQQLRRESISVFYAATPFVIGINTNLHDRYRARKIAAGEVLGWRMVNNTRHSGAEAKRSGRLLMKQHARKKTQRVKNQARFQDVMFKIFWSRRNAHINVDSERFITSIWIKVSNGNVDVDTKTGDGHPDNTDKYWAAYSGFVKEDVDFVLGEAKKVIDAAKDRKEFNGFSMGELEKIARVFRV